MSQLKVSFTTCVEIVWYLNFFLLLKDLSHKLQGDSTSVWTSRLWSLRLVSTEKSLPQMLQTNSELIFLKYVAFLFLLHWLDVADWPWYHGRIWFWDTGKLLKNWVPKSSSFCYFILAKNRQGARSNWRVMASDDDPGVWRQRRLRNPSSHPPTMQQPEEEKSGEWSRR